MTTQDRRAKVAALRMSLSSLRDSVRGLRIAVRAVQHDAESCRRERDALLAMLLDEIGLTVTFDKMGNPVQHGGQ